ncbi:amidohydrolase [Aquiflexum lacus]|uniref:amidohydrolase n=1 Tax=Aquiflexum lacus TaxID=2483805 RepID=UPI0018959E2D|nr:amidohydrolase [Aquiflexum lacus]
MRVYILLFLTFSFIHHTSFSQARVNNSGHDYPDLILHNAKIITLDNERPQAESVSVKNGKIISVGENKDILKSKGTGTIIIDAKGKTVIPGLFDSHNHVIRGGRFYNTELRWDGVRTLERALEMLKIQAERTPPGQWVRVVGGWSPYQFEEQRFPTLEEINKATGDIPTFVLYLYGHAYLNQAGLKALNINSSTPSPRGGLIEKDLDGNPTGLLIAEPSAFLLYSTLAKLPELSQEEQINSTKHYMWELNRLGITSVVDAGGGFQNFPEDYGITDLLYEKQELTVRMPYYLFAQNAGSEFDDYQKWIQSVEIGPSCDIEDVSTPNHFGKRFLEYHVQGGGENLVASAADFENFDQPRPELAPAMETQLKKVLELLISNRWPFRLHATYGESIHRFLNVIEEINGEIPLDGLLWFIDHAETVSENSLQRIKALGGGIAIQHRMAYQGESFIKRYGKELAGGSPPLSRIIELEIPLGMGSDGTRVSSFNPWVGLYWLSTGKTVGGNQQLFQENILSRKKALELYTKGSASLLRLSDRGTISKGMIADFVILSEDYFQIEAEKILEIEALVTVVNGEIVFAQQDFIHYWQELPAAMPQWSPINAFGGYQNRN